MSDIATAGPDRAPSRPQSVPRSRISHRIRRAVDALVTGEAKTQKHAAELAGLNAEHLCRELKKPQIETFYARRSQQIIRSAQMRAVANVVKLMDAKSEHVAADVNFRVLAINGIRPPDDSRQVSVNVGVSVGYVLDLREAGTRAGGTTGGTVIEATVEPESE